MWKNCNSQYDVWFTFGRMELHFISLTRCETGWMKLFTGNGLGAGDKANGHKDSRSYLRPLCIFLWGQMKSLVYCTRPRTIDNLKGNICAVFKDSTPQIFDRVPCSVPFCKNLCKKMRGTNFNICFPDAFSYETELQGHPVYKITRCCVRFWNCILYP
jgi:hypothetical protein